MATILTIAGTPVVLSNHNTYPTRLNIRLKGISTLSVSRIDGALPGLPDPWLGKRATLSVGGTTVFSGDCLDVEPSYTALGWVLMYCFRDLRYRGDRVPMTDSFSLTDSAVYNDSPEDLANYQASRAGRTVGQIVADVLTMTGNATALDAKGIGSYVTLTPPTLPTATLTDLALLTVIPPSPVYVQGERLLSAIESFLSAWAPNHVLWIEPATGAVRIFDLRTFSNHTFTLGTDPIDPTPIRRSVADCFQRVQVRGQPPAEGKLLSTLNGGIAEDFAYGAVTNAAAKAAFTPTDYLADAAAKSEGTCTCTDTLNIVLTPADTTQRWVANYWDQTSTGHQGSLYLTYSVGTGINQFVTRRIVANTANTAGTSSVTVDIPLPATNYDKFTLYGISSGKSLVYRKYKVVDATQAAALAQQFTYPQPFTLASGGMATMTSYPMGSVCYSPSGNPPWQTEQPGYFTSITSPNIVFQLPTYNAAGFHIPSDVRALLAIYTGSLTATYPADVAGVPQYAGTSNTVEGLAETLTVTCTSWRDPGNQAAMDAYAHDMLDSVKDSIVEGTIVYHGLYSAALTPGLAVSVTGSTYTTGWESLAIPVQEIELAWNNGNLTQHTTTMHCSNRKAHFSSSAFLRPDRSREGTLVSGGIEQLTEAKGQVASPGYVAPASPAITPEQSAEMGQQAAEQAASIRTGTGAAGAFAGVGQAATTSFDTATAGAMPADTATESLARADPSEQIGAGSRAATEAFDTGEGAFGP
jgi:hypothetical protein